MKKMDAAGIRYNQFIEPDWNFGLTAVGTEPLREDQRAIFKGYSLWKIEPKVQMVVEQLLPKIENTKPHWLDRFLKILGLKNKRLRK